MSGLKTTIPALPPPIANMIASQLQSQKDTKENDESLHAGLSFHNRTPTKSKSFKLSASPTFRESRPTPTSKDDHALPTTPRRPDFLRNLSLQMPPRDGNSLGLNLNFNLQSPIYAPSTSVKMDPMPAGITPSSPRPDRQEYGSPGSAPVIPRHSRGLDFSRSCTRLHQSTSATSPDSSPTITQKGLMIPPPRMSLGESPGMGSGWDKSAAASSVGSAMMEEESSSSDSDLEPMEADEGDDPMLLTPQVSKTLNPTATTPFAVSPGQWPSAFAPGGQSFLMSHRRSLLRNKGRSRKSSSSASGHSSMASPGPRSPPPANESSGSYFIRETVMKSTAASRRESLSLGTLDLHISSGNDSGDEATLREPPTPARVVRRPVTRRGDMLPRARAFSRIKAELAEESAPADSDIRKEAEVVRQVWEAEPVTLQPISQHSSPTLPPTISAPSDPIDPLDEGSMSLDIDQYPSEPKGPDSEPKGLFAAFGRTTHRNSRDFWNNYDMRTPPPPLFPRASSSAVSDDVNMDSPSAFVNTLSTAPDLPRNGRASTPQAPPIPVLAARKRVRDDDLEYGSIKRRAVSPGMSVTNSPVLSQSPAQREGVWGQKHGSLSNGSQSGTNQGERSNSGGSMASMTPNFGPKRVGLQAMGDTNDGLMKMSIE